MEKSLYNISIARVSTVPFYVLTQLGEQINAIKDAGAIVSVITSPQELNEQFDLPTDFEFIPIYIAREINIKKDIVALFNLWQLFRARRFNIVHSTTPKAGLLCAIAAKLAFVPVRIHTFTGQTWVTLKGIKKIIVKFCDKIIGFLNTCCYADSRSQQTYLIEQKIIKKNKLFVIGEGSLAGVNIKRFSQERFLDLDKQKIKLSLKIDKDALVILFVGRITKDKGVFELISAFKQIIKKHSNSVLLLVGPVELEAEHDFYKRIKEIGSDKILCIGFSNEPERYMAIADILCMPSYREGFGTVVIEAAAMRLPFVGTKIYGLTDAVIEGSTGLLVEPKNSGQLADALEKLIIDKPLRIQMGINAYNRVIEAFDSTLCNKYLVQEYEKLVQNSKLSLNSKHLNSNFNFKNDA